MFSNILLRTMFFFLYKWNKIKKYVSIDLGFKLYGIKPFDFPTASILRIILCFQLEY